jgi:hypothetical protein
VSFLNKKDKAKPISFKTIKSNQKLDGFLQVHEEDEEEVRSA